MVSKQGDSIDFDKLESKVNKAVEDEKLYWLRNDAKFRAVRQKVGTYDEFREIVNAAHLRPLDKEDKINMDQRIKQPWNSHSQGAGSQHGLLFDKADTTETPKAHEVRNIPKDSHSFVKHWRSCSTMQDKVAYLKLIGSECLPSLFKVEIPFGLLGEMIAALSHNCHNHGAATATADVDFSAATLEGLSATGRFQLALSFLSPKEVEYLKDLIDTIALSAADRALALRQAYGTT